MRRSYKYTLRFILCIMLALVCRQTYGQLPAESKAGILLLNSYHPGFFWSDEETRGISDTLRNFDPSLPIYVEYLDSKRNSTPDIQNSLRQILIKKYGSIPIKLILACDNNAIQFALQQRPNIAPSSPIIFCGLNGYTPELLADHTNIIGVIESNDPRKTLRLAHKLCPWARSVFILHDYTTSGLAARQDLKLIETEFSPDLRFIYAENTSFSNTLKQIRNLPADAILFHSIYNIDKNGAYIGTRELGRIIALNAPTPVFTLDESRFIKGGLGGILNRPYEEGRAAAALAVQYLRGTPFSDLPAISESPLFPVFNYDDLLLFDINPELLPEGSSFINKPISFFHMHPRLISAVGIAFVLLSILVILLLRNIFQRRRVEKELFIHRQQLEQQVIERTRKLEKARAHLEIRANDLKKANEYKSQFLAHISHEVRTPLNAIIGFAEVIMYSSSLDFIHQQSRTILSETEHLLSIINQLLDHAKIESGRLSLHNQPMDLHALLETLQVAIRSYTRRKNLTLEINFEDVPRYIFGDAMRLRQILLNLLSNAVKFTEAGSVHLNVEARNTTAVSATLRFAVTDTGIGIAPDQLDSIFKQYEQIDNNLTRSFVGTGLGASIASRLVSLMGGRLHVESIEQSGSTFWFEITVARPSGFTNESLAALTPPQLSINDYSPPKEACILIADDYPSNQSVVRIHLENAGYSCRIADNGLEAIKICESDKIDLILMDISMPVLDGYEATRRIRASGRPGSQIPILALSAHAGAHVRQKCIDAGMNDIIVKPIHRISLLQQLDHWLMSGKQIANNYPAIPPPILNGEVLPMDIKLAIHEFAGRDDLVKEALQYYLAEVNLQLPRMHTACQDLDIDFVGREAHKIAGAAGNLRAMPLARASKQLEELCLSGQPHHAEVMDLLSTTIDRFSELQVYLKQEHFLQDD